MIVGGPRLFSVHMKWNSSLIESLVGFKLVWGKTALFWIADSWWVYLVDVIWLSIYFGLMLTMVDWWCLRWCLWCGPCHSSVVLLLGLVGLMFVFLRSEYVSYYVYLVNQNKYSRQVHLNKCIAWHDQSGFRVDGCLMGCRWWQYAIQ